MSTISLKRPPLGAALRLSLAALAFSLPIAVLAQEPPAAQAPKPVAKNPHGPIKIGCDNCHTSTSWAPIRRAPEFNHNTETRFPLRGLHTDVKCNACHTSRVFSNTPRECAACHADIHRRQFGAACQDCHTVSGWRVAIRSIQDHQGRFPLAGAHATVACESCHRGAASGLFKGLDTACVSCHLPQYQKARPLDHVAANLPTDCLQCHNVDRWQGAKFDHARFTRFALVGKHQFLACASCHVGGRFQGTAADCMSCHVKDFQTAVNPPHKGFPQDCALCHNLSSWKGAAFDHAATTGFALTGSHTTVLCTSCHVAGRYAGTPQQCSGCHLANFESARNPDHRGSAFTLQCEGCHTTAAWKGAKFDHNLSRFTLTGKHVQVDCASCHVNGKFTGTSTVCGDCHRPDFQKAKAPDHLAAGFPTDCQTCHTTADWMGAKFDHDTATKFPLTGKHTSTQCSACHVDNKFAGTSQDCAACHLKDFQATKTPNHTSAGFSPTQCSTCHTTAQWLGGKFDHTTATKFPLTGKHGATQCSACHVNNVFAGTAQDCAACHLKDYQASKNPNHVSAGFPTACVTCHTTVQWTGAKFDHNTSTRFPLTGKHTAAQCSACHVNNVFAGTAQDCAACHLKDYQSAKNPEHAGAGFSTQCTTCHTTAQWLGAKFDHNTATKFPLTGKHSTTQCSACHVNGQFVGTSQDCAACHLKDYQASKNPNHVSAGFPTACVTCHNTVQWTGAKFDHNTATKFPLTGKHTATLCSACHINNQFAGTSQDCAACHLKDFQATKSPNHSSAGFSTQCSSCHTTAQWLGAKFDHSKTRFPLTGKHATTQCEQCHVGGKFTGTATDCAACHLKDYQASKNPNHVTAGFPTACATCHVTTQWTGARFDHNSSTKFPLTGKHVTTQCSACHINNVFAGTSQDCAACHLKDYQATKNPNHTTAGFPTQCATCHTTVQWLGGKFDHSKTNFPLTGRHADTQCEQCHVGGKYAGTATACAACHTKDYQATKNPNHVSAGFPTTCQTCHTTTQWTGTKFDHNTSTKFPLTGKHTTAQCSACHINNVFAGTSQDCAACHLKDYQATKLPNHTSAGFSTQCSSCHTTVQWLGAKFDHSKTKFPLTGKHINTQCDQCHVGGKYAGTPADCAACHLKDFQATKNPNHVSAGFPTACVTCHTTTQWTGAKFDHNTSTKFPLTGKHTTTQCSACHINNVFAGTSQDCAACHLKNYQATKNPNHVSAGFSTQCSTCHTTTQWLGAKFDHSKTKFPLTGKHATTTCEQCHVGGKYTGTSTDCAACHLKDFQATKNPNHVSAGFPTACATCHTTTQWTGAKFDHNTSTKFPLTGKHTTTQCSACHINNVFAGTSQDCAACHLKDYQATKNPNHATAGFPTACATCHTTTQWTGAKFDHNTATKFPLTGKHTTTQCSACHINNVFAGTSQDCASCHLKNYQATTNPNHVSAGFPTTCQTCHTTTQWPGAKFDHNTATKFPLTGKHTTVACSSCHINNKYAGTATNCAGCHLAKYQATTSPNHSAAGFPTTCELCHTTTQWPGAKFDHSTTRFPLTGKHTTVLCASCHVNGKYAGTTMQCSGCHLAKYQATTSPNHAAAGFPTTCETCHTTTQWPGAKFDHNTATKFPLTGKHTTVACASCHINNKYAGTATNCAGCHLAKYQATTSPNHTAAGFPTTCELCHTTTQWPGAKFDHNTATKFPLTGKHTTVACASCHINNKYAGTATTCVGCHLAKYQATASPNHTAAGFPTTCETCHTTTQWPGAKFDHSTTRFPLTGKHTTVACASCHINGKYAGTPLDCVGCHLAKYQATTTPNHTAAGFPTTCQTCHTTTQWPGAKFDHNTATKFPLTGKHTTVACALCHINGKYAGTPTDCYSCHAAAYNATTNPNHKAAGFPTTCATCHTTTQWPGATFTHNAFPITSGAHKKGTWTTCADCHTNSANYTVFSCTNCHQHAKATVDPKHTQVKNYVYNSANCYSCHPQGKT